MAYLVECPVCKHHISSEAANCPSCGDPSYQYRKLRFSNEGKVNCSKCGGKGYYTKYTKGGEYTTNCVYCGGKGVKDHHRTWEEDSRLPLPKSLKGNWD